MGNEDNIKSACNVRKKDGFFSNVMEYNRRRFYYQIIGFIIGIIIFFELVGFFTGALHPVAFFVLLIVTVVGYFILLGLYRRKEKNMMLS